MVGFLSDTMRKRTDRRDVCAQAEYVRVFWGWELILGRGKGHFSTIGEFDRCGLWMDRRPQRKEMWPRQHVQGHLFCERVNWRHRFQNDCSIVYLETLKIVMRTTRRKLFCVGQRFLGHSLQLARLSQHE
jgi:hypothetical protein